MLRIYPRENLPGLANVYDIDAIRTALPEVWLHVHAEILAANVAVGSDHHLDICGSRVEYWGTVLFPHDELNVEDEPGKSTKFVG